MLHSSARGRLALCWFARLWLHEDGVHRRRFIASLGSAIALPCVAAPQQKAMPVIGYLSSTLSGLGLPPFHQGLSETGYVEGHNVAIEYRWAEGRYDRLPALAADLVGRKVDVIATVGPLQR
jgi:putative ABC transport system substrate-binding protein